MSDASIPRGAGEPQSVTVVCPVCRIPFTRTGPTSTTFYRTAQENDTCVVCREGLDPVVWLPGRTS